MPRQLHLVAPGRFRGNGVNEYPNMKTYRTQLTSLLDFFPRFVTQAVCSLQR